MTAFILATFLAFTQHGLSDPKGPPDGPPTPPPPPICCTAQ